MKTKQQILEEVRSGKESKCLDGRDFSRLTDYFEPKYFSEFGFDLADGVDPLSIKVLELTKENVIERLKLDLAFAFEKAYDQRGISASFMYEVVKMWLWVLDDDLHDWGNYGYYGLPLLRAVANKYGFDNPPPPDYDDGDW